MPDSGFLLTPVLAWSPRPVFITSPNLAEVSALATQALHLPANPCPPSHHGRVQATSQRRETCSPRPRSSARSPGSSSTSLPECSPEQLSRPPQMASRLATLEPHERRRLPSHGPGRRALVLTYLLGSLAGRAPAASHRRKPDGSRRSSSSRYPCRAATNRPR